MIVVMDRGYASKSGPPLLAFTADTPVQHLQLAFAAFSEVVIRDLIPTIDASYRTLADREHRAMAGLSMGGMQTLFIALHHLDTFAYVASLSGPVIRGTGPGERLGASLRGPSDTVDALRRSGIRVVFFESPGTAHEWQTWRRSLYDLAPRLFR